MITGNLCDRFHHLDAAATGLRNAAFSLSESWQTTVDKWEQVVCECARVCMCVA